LAAEIRILIVDDHALFRQGLARLLAVNPGFRVVGESATATHAIQALGETNPNIILLDVDLATHTARDFFDLLPPGSSFPVLLVTAATGYTEVARLMRRGARGVFSKSSGVEVLPDAIRAVVSGEVWIDRAYLDLFIDAAAADEAEGRSQPLPSLREQDILALVAGGLSNKQIADSLGISEVGVKAGLQRLFRKFGVGNRAQLLAVASGLVISPRDGQRFGAR